MPRLLILPSRFTCYAHPNGKHSVRQYSSVICESADHAIMTFMGGWARESLGCRVPQEVGGGQVGLRLKVLEFRAHGF